MLPAGWSHPIKASEIAGIFPGVGHVTWNGRPANWQAAQTRSAFWLDWSPKSAVPQPVLTVWAVPSSDRAAVRRWIQQTVALEAGEWLRALDTRSPVWRDAHNSVTWSYTQDDIAARGRPGVSSAATDGEERKNTSSDATVPASISQSAANSDLLNFLRAQAVRPTGPDDYELDGWQLHTHPDLGERLQALGRGWPVSPVYGVPVLAAKGVAAIVAIGTDDLLIRLPRVPSDLSAGSPRPPLTDTNWHAVDAWQSDLPSQAGNRRLSALIRRALNNAMDIAASEPVQERSDE
jgi:hypothetical protein